MYIEHLAQVELLSRVMCLHESAGVAIMII